MRLLHRSTLLIGSIFIAAGIGSVPAIADSNIHVSSTTWNEGDLVTITGTDLEGAYVRNKKLCFSPAIDTSRKTCFGRYDEVNKMWVNDDDPYLQRWDKTILTFNVPPVMPSRGVLMLLLTNEEERCYGSAGCLDLPTVEEIKLTDFTTVPRVDEVVDVSTGLQATSIASGKSYEIHGALFGADPHAVSFGAVTQGRSGPKYTLWSTLSSLDILAWSDQSIVFKPTATPDITGGLKVNNSVVDSNIALIDGQPSGAISSHSQSSSSAISQSAPPPAFPDVPATHPYAEAVQWAKDRGVLRGYPDGTFRPNNIVNRAEFLKIILSAQGNVAMDAAQDAEFSDVDSTAWYALFIRYAKTRGIVQGYPDGTFKPNQTVTLAEGLKIAYKALDVQTEEADGEWYERYLQHAKTNDVLFTTDIDPAQGMTRKDVVWIVWKLLGRS